METKKQRFQIGEACMGIPALSIYGDWLEESGFMAGEEVEVYYSKDLLVVARVIDKSK